MTTSLDREKSELLDRATELALSRKGAGGPPQETVEALLKGYYRHVAPEDVCVLVRSVRAEGQAVAVSGRDVAIHGLVRDVESEAAGQP